MDAEDILRLKRINDLFLPVNFALFSGKNKFFLMHKKRKVGSFNRRPGVIAKIDKAINKFWNYNLKHFQEN